MPGLADAPAALMNTDLARRTADPVANTLGRATPDTRHASLAGSTTLPGADDAVRRAAYVAREATAGSTTLVAAGAGARGAALLVVEALGRRTAGAAASYLVRGAAERALETAVGRTAFRGAAFLTRWAPSPPRRRCLRRLRRRIPAAETRHQRTRKPAGNQPHRLAPRNRTRQDARNFVQHVIGHRIPPRVHRFHA